VEASRGHHPHFLVHWNRAYIEGGQLIQALPTAHPASSGAGCYPPST
jgi:hypothetical protein